MEVVISVNDARRAKAIDVLRHWFPAVRAFEHCVLGKTVDINDRALVSTTVRRTVSESTRRSAFEIGTMGTIGCYLSHTNVWKALVESGLEYAIVFEDDPQIVGSREDFARFKSELPKLLRAHPDTDVVLFGQTYVPKVSRHRFMSFRSVDHVFEGLLGYVITRHGAQTLLAEAFPMIEQVDAYMGTRAFLGESKIWVFEPPLVAQNATQGSSIQDICISCLLPNDNMFYIGLGIAFLVLTLYLSFRTPQLSSSAAPSAASAALGSPR